MKTRMLFVLPIVMASLFLTFSCREPEKETFYMPQEFKDYVMFPVGSYWVYEDSASGAIDSIYLKSSEIEIYEPPHSDYNFENLKQTFYSSYNNLLFESRVEYYIDIFEYYGGGYFFDISKGIKGTQDSELISITDSIIIHNKSFYNVACIKSDFGNFYYFYWVKEIGLIKKSDSSSTWLLKKYFINH